MPDTSKATASPPHLANGWARGTEPRGPLPPSAAETVGGAPSAPPPPLPGWLERTGTLPPQQLSHQALGPVALSEEPLRFSPPTPAPSRAAAAAFPRLDLNYPPLPTAAALPSPTPSALRPPEERRRPGAGAERRRDGSLRRRAPPKGRASSSRTRGERHQRGLPVSSHFILQSRGPRRTQPTIKSAPAPFLLPPCFSSGAWRGG